MLDIAFTVWSTPVTWLEVAAFVLAIACIVCNVRELHWGWPLAVVSSLLYAWLFYASKLYGEGTLQIFFALTGLWGWWQWLFGTREAKPLHIARFSVHHWRLTFAAWLALWWLLGTLLQRYTDSPVPWLDAFPTAGSVIATVVLARKFIENWPLWVAINVASVLLFGFKQLYLTVVLYLIFIALALWGWGAWRRRLQADDARVSPAPR
ncbi:MAG: nicotinamide riboside transporter PnuC [Betaproteobacteria bacterium]|nr:nicotinamide riboside transporter PnuC [Betaproteobacteria bacterium]